MNLEEGMNPYSIAPVPKPELKQADDSLSLKAFSAGLALLNEHFRKDEPSEELLAVYFDIVKGLSDAQFQAAVRTAILEERYFPPLKKLIEYGKEVDRTPRAEQQLFIAPSENEFDPNSSEAIEARERVRVMVQGLSNQSTVPKVSEVVDDGWMSSVVETEKNFLSSVTTKDVDKVSGHEIN